MQYKGMQRFNVIMIYEFKKLSNKMKKFGSGLKITKRIKWRF
jgi:hypothetical protein